MVFTVLFVCNKWVNSSYPVDVLLIKSLGFLLLSLLCIIVSLSEFSNILRRALNSLYKLEILQERLLK